MAEFSAVVGEATLSRNVVSQSCLMLLGTARLEIKRPFLYHLDQSTVNENLRKDNVERSPAGPFSFKEVIKIKCRYLF